MSYRHLTVPYPNFPEKHLATPLVTPQRFIDFARSRGHFTDFVPPKGVLLVYQHSLMTRLIETEAAEHQAAFAQGSLYKLPKTGGAVGLLGNFGIGGPVVGVLVEELAALGVTHFFSFGLAGGLQLEGRLGDVVLCTSAIRDEGVSHHYLPADSEARPSPNFTDAVARVLTDLRVAYRQGPTWTIDTPYRETVEEVRHYRAAGVLSVEMEAAALFAVATVRGVEAASAFVLSDLLGETEWTPDFGAEHLTNKLQLVAAAGVLAIQRA